MSFIVDLLDASEDPIGAGPLENVIQVNVTESLDEAGQVQFTLPATDYRAATLIDTAVRFRVRLDSGSYIYGLIGQDIVDAASATPQRTVTGQDLIGELANYSCGWWCFYDTDDLNADILPVLLTAAGWSAGTFDAGLGDFYGRFDGDSILSALIKILNQTPGIHFRMGSTIRTLDVGAFGDVATVRFTNVHHALYGQSSNTEIAIIGSLRITSDRGPLVNRIIPWGAGADDGNVNRAKVKLFHLDPASALWANIKAKPGLRGAQTQITEVTSPTQLKVTSTAGFLEWPIMQLMWCTDPADLTAGFAYDFVIDEITDATHLTIRGSPSLPTSPSVNDYLIGNPQLYLEDATEFAANPHEAVIIFNDITLTELTSGEWAKGALQLYYRAKRYLDTHKVAQVTYTLTALYCPESVRVGDKVKVIYRGVATRSGTAYKWIDLDETLWVTKITRTYNADGSTAATLEVSNVDTRPNEDSMLIYDKFLQVNSINRSAG